MCSRATGRRDIYQAVAPDVMAQRGVEEGEQSYRIVKPILLTW